MSKLNQTLKQELLQATKPKNIFLRAYGDSEDDFPIYKIDTDCEPSQGHEDTEYCYAVLSFFTDNKTIEPNKFLSRHSFNNIYGHVEFLGKIGFRRRENNIFSIDLNSLHLRTFCFADDLHSNVSLLDRDVTEDLLQAITEQLQSAEYRTDVIELIGRSVVDYEENAIPF
ncbi:hypothetical protein [uncultured Psychrobacter sp.]|uniref:hypothetical protein n=1 Tax=uncultured Psychrobacter sp. TaxID=259303 RepID=UPI0030DD16CE